MVDLHRLTHCLSWPQTRQPTSRRFNLFNAASAASLLQNLEHPQSCLHWTHQSAQQETSRYFLSSLSCYRHQSTSQVDGGWYYEISMQYSGDYPFSPGILILTRIQWTKTGCHEHCSTKGDVWMCVPSRDTRHKPSPSHHHRWAIFMAGISTIPRLWQPGFTTLNHDSSLIIHHYFLWSLLNHY